MIMSFVPEDSSLQNDESEHHRGHSLRNERRQYTNTRIAIIILTPFLILLIGFWLFAIARAKSILSQARNIFILQIANVIMVVIDVLSAPTGQKEPEVVRPAINGGSSDNTSETDDEHPSSDHPDVELHSLLVQRNQA